MENQKPQNVLKKMVLTKNKTTENTIQSSGIALAENKITENENQDDAKEHNDTGLLNI